MPKREFTEPAAALRRRPVTNYCLTAGVSIDRPVPRQVT